MSVTTKKTAITQTVAILRKKNLVFAECRTTPGLSSDRRAPNLRRSKQMVGLVAIELVLGDEVCGELFLGSSKSSLSFMGPFRPELLSTRTQVFSRRARSVAVAT